MPNIDYTTIWKNIAALAETEFKGYASQATQDGQDFVQKAKAKFENYVAELAADHDEDIFRNNILDLEALADMERLKEEEFAQVALDKFTNGIIDILIDAGLSAIK